MAYRRLNGRNGQFSSFQDGGSVTVNSSMGDGLTNKIIYLLNQLQTYSIYVVDVTGRTGSLYNTSVLFETNLKGIYQCCIQVTAWHEYCNCVKLHLYMFIFQFHLELLKTLPSSTPCTSTSVTISWDSVECIHRNGLITHYIISYGPVGEANLVTNVRVNNGGQDDGLSYIVSGLESSTNSIFKFAAVNEAGVGIYAVIQGKTISSKIDSTL